MTPHIRKKSNPAASINLNYIQQYIKAYEGIFFNAEYLPIDCTKINSNYSTYDCAYDSKVRRKDISLIIFMDEVLLDLEIGDFSTSHILYALEENLYTPDFYRGFIFNESAHDFSQHFAMLCIGIDKNMALFKKNVGVERYNEMAAAFSINDIPPTKEKFIEEMNGLRRQLSGINESFQRLLDMNSDVSDSTAHMPISVIPVQEPVDIPHHAQPV